MITCEIDCENLYLPGHKEGFGSAFQMQLGAYALAKHYRLDFLLTPMRNIGHSQKFNYSQPEWDRQFFEYTRDFLLPGSVVDDKGFEKTDMKVSLFLEKAKSDKNFFSDKIVNLDWREMKQVIDSNIFLLNNIKAELIASRPQVEKNSFSVALHVRRYTEEDTDPSQWRDYYVPNTPNGLVEVAKELMQNRQGEFHVYSQGDYSQFNYFEQLSSHGKVVFHLDEHPLKSLNGMINSDLFLMAKSSFSYVASVYRKHSYYRGSFQHALTDGTHKYEN
jgi:hypothetical protein